MGKIYDSPEWFSDIDEASQIVPELSTLAGQTILLTGAAGLICSAVTDIFIRYNETHDIPIHIIAAGRWPEEMSNRFGEYCNRDYFQYVSYDASKTDNHFDVHADYIIHGASNASPKAIVAEPVETMLSNFNGLYFLLNYARETSAKRLLYISSSEVYGQKANNTPYSETDYGFIDLLNPRNSYSVGKRAAETLCASYFAEYGVESVIVRPGHIYGPTASPYDDRISSAFAYAAARGETLIMKSEGTQLRSYCHCLDCATAIIKVLMKGTVGQAYNISNPDSVVTIRQMAEAVAKAGHVRIEVQNASEKEHKSYNLMDNSALNAEKLMQLGWRGYFTVERGMEKTISILEEVI